MRHLGLREFTNFYLTTRLNLSPRINPILNVDPTAAKLLLYRPAMLRQWHGLSPLDIWEGDWYIPLTIFGSCDRLSGCVDVGIVNEAATMIILKK